jgi:hypothetical protein
MASLSPINSLHLIDLDDHHEPEFVNCGESMTAKYFYENFKAQLCESDFEDEGEVETEVIEETQYFETTIRQIKVEKEIQQASGSHQKENNKKAFPFVDQAKPNPKKRILASIGNRLRLKMKLFTCERCKKEFKRKQDLYSHKPTHCDRQLRFIRRQKEQNTVD